VLSRRLYISRRHPDGRRLFVLPHDRSRTEIHWRWPETFRQQRDDAPVFNKTSPRTTNSRIRLGRVAYPVFRKRAVNWSNRVVRTRRLPDRYRMSNGRSDGNFGQVNHHRLGNAGLIRGAWAGWTRGKARGIHPGNIGESMPRSRQDRRCHGGSRI